MKYVANVKLKTIFAIRWAQRQNKFQLQLKMQLTLVCILLPIQIEGSSLLSHPWRHTFLLLPKKVFDLLSELKRRNETTKMKLKWQQK